MQKHLNDGELRAALDGELDARSLQHLETCTSCQMRQQQLQEKQREAGRLLAFFNPAQQTAPSAQRAWGRLSQKIMLQKEISMTKKWFSFPLVRFGFAALALLTLFLAFPGSRAWAGEF